MNALKSKASKLVASGLIAMAMLPALASQPVAASMDNPELVCPGGVGEAEVVLPVGGSARMSQFYVSFDGGQWQYTDWYYTSNGQAWIWNSQNGWNQIFSYTGLAREFFVNGSHTVAAWELRYPAGGSGQWVNLGTCTTTDFWG